MTVSDLEGSEEYWLGRDYWAASRLNLQHFMYKSAQKFLVHPVIQAHLRRERESKETEDKAPQQIADLATGTGIWMFDLLNSQEVNGLDIQYRGFDISGRLYPHDAWLPKGVSLSLSNLFEEPPQAFHGQFDLVHIRLVIALVSDANPKKIIQHIKTLLKPGGYIQWDELDPINHHDIMTTGPEDQVPGLRAIFGPIRNLFDASWVEKIPKFLEEEGFQDAVQTQHEPPSELFKAWAYMDLCVVDEFSRNGVGRQDKASAERWRNMIPGASAEIDSSGAVLKVCPTVTIARKPL
ncbi:hypothetical protein F4861DRAFT_428184 [Xylaria intraflava]|nr:hypothetical protein F4861DRAFT_428184 [Xylaria intraflava]